jgi:hypothetical protein
MNLSLAKLSYKTAIPQLLVFFISRLRLCGGTLIVC